MSLKANSPSLESLWELRCFWKRGEGPSPNLEHRKVFGELMQSLGKMSGFVFVRMSMEISVWAVTSTLASELLSAAAGTDPGVRTSHIGSYSFPW